MHSILPSWYVSKRNRRRRRKAATQPIINMPEDYVANFRANTLELTVGDTIALWPDLSGNVNDALQENEDLQPTLQSVTFVGKTFRVARFDNTDDGMTTPLTIGAESPFSIFTLWRPSVLGDFSTALISSASLDWSMGTFASGMLCYFTGFTAGGTVNTTDFYLFEARIIPGEQPHAIYLNGIQAGLQPGGASSGPEQITFGASGSNGYPAACDCAEILIYDRFLSDEEAAAVRTYFQSQYNYLKL